MVIFITIEPDLLLTLTRDVGPSERRMCFKKYILMFPPFHLFSAYRFPKFLVFQNPQEKKNVWKCHTPLSSPATKTWVQLASAHLTCSTQMSDVWYSSRWDASRGLTLSFIMSIVRMSVELISATEGIDVSKVDGPFIEQTLTEHLSYAGHWASSSQSAQWVSWTQTLAREESKYGVPQRARWCSVTL